jgi:hypothetical protein
MPKVGGKHYAYNDKGRAAAKKAKIALAKKKKKKTVKKRSA